LISDELSVSVNIIVKSSPPSVALSPAMRRRVERLAKREGRSFEAQLERVIASGLEAAESENVRPRRGKRSLAGLLASQRAPTIDELREVRNELSARLLEGATANGRVRR
jgi:hypothetical protein